MFTFTFTFTTELTESAFGRITAVNCLILQHALMISSSALTQVDVLAALGSVTAIMTAVIHLMNWAVVSNFNVIYIWSLFMVMHYANT